MTGSVFPPGKSSGRSASAGPPVLHLSRVTCHSYLESVRLVCPEKEIETTDLSYAQLPHYLIIELIRI